MRIYPQQKLKDNIFYNNICIIVCIFCIACFFTANYFQFSVKKPYYFENIENGTTIGPIKINKKSAVYKVTATFSGNNASTYLTGEVLDENKDTLYEFGKDLWHESGYDSEGRWSEADRKMVAYLTFSEKGTYYIQFFDAYNVSIKLDLQNGSSVAHNRVGLLFLIIILIAGYSLNKKWVDEKSTLLMDGIEEALDV